MFGVFQNTSQLVNQVIVFACLLTFGLALNLAMKVQFAGPAYGSETEKPKELIAEQLRRQGFKCDKPQSAKRDEAATKPDEVVWILSCENASYRVKLIPDMAADVTQLD